MESCRVITPFGSFSAHWPEDAELPVAFTGVFGAIAYFRNYLETQVISGEGGKRVLFDYLQPGELRGFCDSEEFGIVVEQSGDDLPEEEGTKVATLDSVSDDPATEAMEIIDQLNSGEGDRTDLCNRLAFLLPQVEFYNADEEEAFQEAAAQAMGKE